MDSYDVIVVGAGVVGSSAAYQAAKAGYRVLLLEQFEFNHQMGSSYGAGRIVRYAYDHPPYVQLAKSAFPAWREIEAEAGETLVTITGGINFGLADDQSLRDTIDSLQIAGIPFEMLSVQEQQKRFPQFHISDDMQIVYQADSGIVRASKAVLTLERLAEQHGATLKDHSPVIDISMHSDSVKVQTPDAAYSAAKLILVPGAWGKKIIGMVGIDLPLTPVHAQEQYFAAEPAADYTTDRFPVFIAHMSREFGVWPYGLPSIDGSGLKVGMHGGPAIPDVDMMDREPLQGATDTARAFMSRHIPGGNRDLLFARTCLYTMTPDEHFVLDTHPAYPHVAFSASCSGHGFKFGPVLGEILVQLAFNGSSTYDLAMFSASRFGARERQ